MYLCMNRIAQLFFLVNRLRSACAWMAAYREVSTPEAKASSLSLYQTPGEVRIEPTTSVEDRDKEPFHTTLQQSIELLNTMTRYKVVQAQADTKQVMVRKNIGSSEDQACCQGNHTERRGDQGCHQKWEAYSNEDGHLMETKGTRRGLDLKVSTPYQSKTLQPKHKSHGVKDGCKPHKKPSPCGNAVLRDSSCWPRDSGTQKSQTPASSVSPANKARKTVDSMSDSDGGFLFALDVEGLLMERMMGQCTGERVAESVQAGQRGEKRQLDDGSSKGVVKESRAKQKRKRGKEKDTERPNAFVSIRVRSPFIRMKVEEVQAAMEEKDSKVVSSFVSPKKLHVTMMVFNLNGNEQIEKAKAALRDASVEVMQMLKVLEDPLTLQFAGLGSFGERVVYAALKNDAATKKLTQIADIVIAVFEKNGFQSAGVQGQFSPHLTIAKTRGYSQRGKLKPEIYAELLDTEFGNESVTGLELLSMTFPEDKDGYYHCFQSYTFAELLQ